jgi:general secretion pathway protein G
VRRGERGVTYLELVVTVGIVAILASAVLPLGRVTVKRQKELELRRALRTIRMAIDRYHDMKERGELGTAELGDEFYPQDLELLVEGETPTGAVDTKKKVKFLRRIPKDPFTGDTDWGKHCYEDRAESRSWCRDNVWDVYSKSGGTGLDGTPYAEW